jgi:hypothetical protein
LGILPEGYIYAREHRPVRDLARKRMFLVQHRTANILSLKSLLQRSCSIKLSANDIRKVTADDLEEWLKDERCTAFIPAKNIFLLRWCGVFC